MSNIVEFILAILILYILIGDVLWMVGLKAYGGAEAYKEFLREQNIKMPLGIVFFIFVLVWPFFLKEI